jgi:hypothetical protein
LLLGPLRSGVRRRGSSIGLTAGTQISWLAASLRSDVRLTGTHAGLSAARCCSSRLGAAGTLDTERGHRLLIHLTGGLESLFLLEFSKCLLRFRPKLSIDGPRVKPLIIQLLLDLLHGGGILNAPLHHSTRLPAPLLIRARDGPLLAPLHSTHPLVAAGLAALLLLHPLLATSTLIGPLVRAGGGNEEQTCHQTNPAKPETKLKRI